MRKPIYLALFLLIFTGCHVSPKLALKGAGGRNAYNSALLSTSNEQMLLNLIRLRYCDSPYFLNISNITTQFTFEADVSTSIPIPGFDSENPGSFGGDLMWRNQPTISYTPLEGQSFADHLLQPLDLMVIQYLVYSGWDIDRIFRLTIQSFNGVNNIPMAAGPLPEGKPEYKDFYEITALMRKLQLENQLQIGTKTKEQCEDKPQLIKNNNGSIRATSIQIAFPADTEDGKRLNELLHGSTESKRGKYILDMDLGFEKDALIGIMPRSILSIMYYLSLGVKIPPSQLHMVTNIINPDGTYYDWADAVGTLVNVKYAHREPKNAFVAVKYKGHWFYIDECDVNSKRTFTLLQGLYNLQSGNTPQSAPILSIPLG